MKWQVIDISDSQRIVKTCLDSCYFTSDICNASICAQASQAYLITFKEERFSQFDSINLVNVYTEMNPALDVTRSFVACRKNQE